MATPARPLAELVTITATDKLQLPALFYEPAKPSQRLLIWLHGMGSSGIFYNTTHTNALAAALTHSGTAFLGLQNRGGGLLQGIRYLDGNEDKQNRLQGTSHELIAECVHDINGALVFAKSRGYTEIFLGGHSTGANKVAVYNFLEPKNPIAGYIIYGGGDDTGLFHETLGAARYKKSLTESRRQVKAGHGADLAPLDFMDDYFSYQSIVDILDPDGLYNTFPYYEAQNSRLGTKPLFQEFKSIIKPSLVIYGALDPYCLPNAAAALKLLQRECSAPTKFTFTLIPGGDHNCYQHEPELARTIADWVVMR